MRRVRETTVPVEKQKILYICVCGRARACVCPGVWEYACVYVHVALLIPHGTRTCRNVTAFVFPLAPPYV
jgi:hypothetical protein